MELGEAFDEVVISIAPIDVNRRKAPSYGLG
jgi:hypothetical protein